MTWVGFLVVLVLCFSSLYSFLPLFFSCLAKHFNNLSFDYKLWECCHIIDCTNKCMFIVNIYLFIFSNLMSSDDSYSDKKRERADKVLCHFKKIWQICMHAHLCSIEHNVKSNIFLMWQFGVSLMMICTYIHMYVKLTEISE